MEAGLDHLARRRLVAFFAAAVVLALPAAASAGPSRLTSSQRGTLAAARVRLVVPMQLPAAGGHAAAAAPYGWIVGARPGARADAIAAGLGAKRELAGVYRVPAARARALAGAFRAAGLLRYAERNVRARTQALPADPLTTYEWWIPAVADPSLTPPPVTASSPALAMVDSQPDLTRPDLSGPNIELLRQGPVTDEHGTATTAVASALANGVGITGLWPGMRIISAPTDLTCADIAHEIAAAVSHHAAVINMSFGSSEPCFTADYLATGRAFGAGAVLVASGGNEFDQGNLPDFPASSPHVVTVAAVDRNLQSAFFSNENAGIDLSAPGVGILTDVPIAHDDDGTADGYELLDGTSFSAPIVAAAASWVRAARPSLRNDQIAGVLDGSARDLGAPGWDQRYGYGLLDLAAALRAHAPSHDPGEPNDDVPWIDGSLTGRRAGAIWSGHGTRLLGARVDQWEDPADVYRVVVPGRSSARIALRPTLGDADLLAYSARADSIYNSDGSLSGSHLVAHSQRNGTALDAVRVHNGARHAVSFYVAVEIDPTVRTLNADYRLSVARTR